MRRLRERADLSATGAAARLGVTQSRISNIEAGRYGVSADRVRALARLRMQFGGAAVARDQLQHLLSIGDRENVTILVIPFGAGQFPSSARGVDYVHGLVTQLDTVQIDPTHGGEIVDSPAQMEVYRQVLDRMEEVALPTNQSRDLLHSIVASI